MFFIDNYFLNLILCESCMQISKLVITIPKSITNYFEVNVKALKKKIMHFFPKPLEGFMIMFVILGFKVL